jgi:predicted DsbA family dithiol-disulfide isomerase
MTAAKPLQVDVVIDVVCPWCFLGKRRLDKALELVPDLDLSIRYRPFQLDPTLPPEGKDRTRYMLDKFHDQARIDAAHKTLEALGAELGIAFAFDRISVAPNTLDAHRLLRWASEAGKGDAAAERLFALYFEEGADFTRPETLIKAAADVGLDANEVATKLADGTDREAVQAEIDFASRVGITGVPCYVVANKYAISGAQAPEVLADAFRQIAGEPA